MSNPTNNKNLNDLLKKSGSESFDDFEREALEGFNTLESSEEALEIKSKLDKRIYDEVFSKKKTGIKIYWYAAAALILVIGSSIYLLLNSNAIDKKNEMAIVQNELAAPEKTPEQSPDQKPAADNTPPAETNGTAKGQVKNEERLSLEKTVSTGQAYASDKNKAGSLAENTPVTKQEINRLSEGAKADKSAMDDYKNYEEEKKPGKENAKENEGLEREQSSPKGSVTDELETDSKKRAKDSRKDQNQITTASRSEPAAKLKDVAEQQNDLANKKASGGYVNTPDRIDGDLTKKESKEKKTAEKPSAPSVNAGMQSEKNDFANANNCYYSGGEDAIVKDLREKLVEIKMNKKFEATLFINEKKEVEKVVFTKLYDLNKDDEIHIAEVLKSLNKFNFFTYPTVKSLFEYKLVFKP